MNSFDIHVHKYCNYWVDINAKSTPIIEIHVVKIWQQNSWVDYKIRIRLSETPVTSLLSAALSNSHITGLFQSPH